MKVIRDRPFVSKTIPLDNHHFDNCRFESCIFVYSGTANFGLTNSQIADNCEFQLDGVAASTMKVMQSLYSTSEWGKRVILRTLEDAVPAFDRLH